MKVLDLPLRCLAQCEFVVCFLQPADSPCALAASADYTFAMLSDPQAAIEVASGPKGIVAGEHVCRVSVREWPKAWVLSTRNMLAV